MQSTQDEKDVAYLGPPDNPDIYVDTLTTGLYVVYIPHSHNDAKYMGGYTFQYFVGDDASRIQQAHVAGLLMGEYPSKNLVKLK